MRTCCRTLLNSWWPRPTSVLNASGRTLSVAGPLPPPPAAAASPPAAAAATACWASAVAGAPSVSMAEGGGGGAPVRPSTSATPI